MTKNQQPAGVDNTDTTTQDQPEKDLDLPGERQDGQEQVEESQDNKNSGIFRK